VRVLIASTSTFVAMLSTARCLLVLVGGILGVSAFDLRSAVSRRHAVMGVAGTVLGIAMPPPARASGSTVELTDVIERAREGKLNTARVFKRVEKDALVDASAVSCDAVDALLVVNKKAMRIEQQEIDRLHGVLKSVDDHDFYHSDASIYRTKLANAEKTASRLSNQVTKLDQVRTTCAAGNVVTRL